MSQILTPQKLVLLSGGEVYLLRDEFTTDRAAGVVNGTAAEPGPGTRKTVENDGSFSISNGKLVITAQTTPAWGDLGFFLTDAVTRKAGRMFLIKINESTLGNTSLGWSTDPSFTGPNSEPIVAVDWAGAIYERDYGLTLGLSAALTANVDYYFGFIMRSNGGFYFVKGGTEFPNWTLLWHRLAFNTTPNYVELNTYSSSGTVDWIRVPQSLWLPTPAAYDSFTRANGPLGNSETSGSDGQPCASKPWVDSNGTWVVSGQKAMTTVVGEGWAGSIASLDVGVHDKLISAKIDTSTYVGAGVVAAGISPVFVDNNNWVIAYVNQSAGAVYFWKMIGGIATNLITQALGPVPGAELAVRVNGQGYTVFYNGAMIGATQTISDSIFVNKTKVGLIETDTGVTIDDVAVFPYGSNGEYSALDKWSA